MDIINVALNVKNVDERGGVKMNKWFNKYPKLQRLEIKYQSAVYGSKLYMTVSVYVCIHNQGRLRFIEGAVEEMTDDKVNALIESTINEAIDYAKEWGYTERKK